MITPIYGMHTETRTCSLFYHDPSVEPLLSHPIIMFNIYMSSCFLFREMLPRSLGSIWIIGITHFMLSDFWPTIYLMLYWGIFHFRWDLRIFMESHDHLRLRDTHRDEDLFVILSWSSSGALLKSFILTCTFRHLDAIILPLLRCVFFIRGSDSVMDSDDEDRTPEDRWLEAIWFFWPITHLMPYWGIFIFWLRFVDLHWFS